ACRERPSKKLRGSTFKIMPETDSQQIRCLRQPVPGLETCDDAGPSGPAYTSNHRKLNRVEKREPFPFTIWTLDMDGYPKKKKKIRERTRAVRQSPEADTIRIYRITDIRLAVTVNRPKMHYSHERECPSLWSLLL